MLRLAVIITVMISIVPQIASSQEQAIPDTTSVIETDLESILENATQDAEDSELIDLISRLEENPLDINTSSFDELVQIPGLDAILAQNILDYRALQPFESINDLLRVEGMTEDIFEMVKRFITASRGESTFPGIKLGALRFRSRTQQDIQKRRGYLDNKYLGSPLKLYNRLTLRSTPVQLFSEGKGTTVELGLLSEKDAGEVRLNDYMAGYLDLKNVGPLRGLIIGDYVVEAAHGLVLWRSMSFGKGSDVLQPFRKTGGGIRSYLSTEENFYFRGVASTISISRFTMTFMYSNKPLHATLNENGTLTSLYSGGLFRTESEQLRKNSTRERFVGGRITYDIMKGFHIGATGYSARLAHPLALSGTFGISGESMNVGSIDGSYTDKRMSVFSEIARDQDGTIAGVAGLLYRPVRGFNVVLVGRDYPKDFKSFHGNGFGESDGTKNERGIYFGTRFKLTNWLQLSTYYDHFSFPWRTSLIRMPSDGNDLLSLAEISITRKVKLSLQYKEKSKGISLKDVGDLGLDVRSVGMRSQKNYRATFDYTPSITFRWRTRFELVDVHYASTGKRERGILLYQDLRLYPLRRLLVYTRLAAFQTDSFDSRVYEFENDVRGTFSNPSLFGKGIRWYVTSRYEVTRNIDIWFRYSVTQRDGIKTISSGLNEIKGDLDNRVTIQLDVEF